MHVLVVFERNCDNFGCFQLLLNQKEVDMNYRSIIHHDTALIGLVRGNKNEFLSYVMEKRKDKIDYSKHLTRRNETLLFLAVCQSSRPCSSLISISFSSTYNLHLHP